jgi:REP element-mobilizing transposase RayT
LKPAPTPVPRRRALRLKGYDYAQAGAYFVTICVRDRTCLFGNVVGGEMRVNDFGRLLDAAWRALPHHYPHVDLDRFVVMPNHFHGIVVLRPVEDCRGEIRAGERHGLPEIVRAFETFSARRINEFRGTHGVPVWQRNYYEHVIRDEADYRRIAEYVAENPRRWSEDSLYNADGGGAGHGGTGFVGAGLKPAPTQGSGCDADE